jgi:hypothetical protein
VQSQAHAKILAAGRAIVSSFVKGKERTASASVLLAGNNVPAETNLARSRHVFPMADWNENVKKFPPLA